MLTITKAQWAKFAPNCPGDYVAALFDHMGLLADAGILDNERRWCHFAATVYHETGDFREIREDLSYKSTKALRKAWPSRFGAKSDAELKHLLRNPIGLADVVYGCYSGRRADVIGDVKPGEAIHWRGGGWFNTTFKPSVERYCVKLGVTPAPLNALDDPILTLKMAVLEWTETECNRYADENNLRKLAKAINTGSADSGIEPVGMDGRKLAFARAWALWGETGTAEKPAREIGMTEFGVKVGTPLLVAGEAGRQVINAAPPVDPAAQIGVAKKVVEHAAEVKALGASGSELMAGALGNPWPYLTVVVALAAIWAGPMLWRKFR